MVEVAVQQLSRVESGLSEGKQTVSANSIER